jgi:GNAT superfamily N-acetyltransferase
MQDIILIEPTPEGMIRFEASFFEMADIQDFKKDFAKNFFTQGLILEQKGKPVARVGIYVNPYLRWEEEDVITLGAYACNNDDQAAQTLLGAALEFIQTKWPECQHVIGPMDGSTWENYRFALPSDHAPFVLEPINPPWYPQHWEKMGFQVLKKYKSNQAEFGPEQYTNLEQAKLFFEQKGLIFRHFDALHVEEELNRLAEFNLAAFHDAFLITPIEKVVFVEKYQKIVPLLRPELIWIAEDNGRICGLFFAIPDYLDAQKRTVVVKTLARLPDARYKGLGEYLAALWVNTAIEAGYTRMIHALMRDDNASVRTSGKFWGESFREYVLYGRLSDKS